MKICRAESGISTAPISWQAAELERIEIEGVRGFAMSIENFELLGNRLTGGNLPVEFFNHQLMDCDLDEQDVCDFMSRWGLLFSPFRHAASYSYVSLDASAGMTGVEQTATLERALTVGYDEAEREFERMWKAGEIDEENEEAAASKLIRQAEASAAGRVISLEEAFFTLQTLQAVVEAIRNVAHYGWESSNDLFLIAETLNVAASNSLVVELTPDCFYGLELGTNQGHSYRACLTSAICNQIIACLADKAPWRICECEGCGRVFKRKQAKTSNPNSDSKYCCDQCMERQKKRNQRNAAKNRIQH